jgi:hypothetical protein
VEGSTSHAYVTNDFAYLVGAGDGCVTAALVIRDHRGWESLKRYTGLTIEIENIGLMDSLAWGYCGEPLLKHRGTSHSESLI